jgi:biotin operon repressor
MKATHKECWVGVRTGRGEAQVKLEPGQFIFGRESAAKELEMSPSTLWKRMLKLRDLGNLKIESDSKHSIITLTNWGLYQIGPKKVTDKEQRKTEKSDSKSDSKNYRQDKGLRELGDSESDSEKTKKVTHTRSNKVSKDTLRPKETSDLREFDSDPREKGKAEHEAGGSLGSAREERRKPPSKKKGKSPDSDPRVKAYILEWNDPFFKKTGKPYVPSWGKEGKIVKDLLKVYSLDELRELRKEFFRSERPFIQNSGYTIGVFRSVINDLAADLARDPVEQARRDMAKLREEDEKGEHHE